MSRFDYSKNPVIKRVDTVEITTGDYLDILTSNDLNRVQKVLAIRNKVYDMYSAYRDVTVRFVDGVITDLIDSSKQEGRPLPSILRFEVEMYMPVVVASDVPVAYKSGRDYKDEYRKNIPPTWRADNDCDHIFWS